MIKVILLTGFLGSGKTTMLNALLEHFDKTRIGVVVNEFGKTNIDSKLLKKDGIALSELSNGSIFCACLKEHFLKSLITMSAYELDYLFIEASGLADPSNMGQILKVLEPKIKQPYHYMGSIAIVNAETFVKMLDVFPAIQQQIAYASAVIINKTDLVEQKELSVIYDSIFNIDQAMPIYETHYCRADYDEILSILKPSSKETTESVNTPDNRLTTVRIKDPKCESITKLREFLKIITPHTYRIKGFIETDEGILEVSTVNERIDLRVYDESIHETELVFISSIGLRIIKHLSKAKSHLTEGEIRL